MTEDVRTVTAVIPTIGRPELRLAVESALRQSGHLLEVIVAADTDGDLDLPDDDRIRVVRTGPRAGGNVARMAGIRAARGELIALLDDDDSWCDDKLQRQLAQVRAVANPRDLWLSSSLVQEPSGRVWPQRLIDDEPLPEYLFRKTRVKAGQGAMHTSTLLFPKALCAEVPFDEALRFHQDTDWLVRIDRAVRGLRVVQVALPLTRLGDGAGSVSRGIRPERSLEWAKRSLAHLDRRTRGDFLLTVTYFQACRHRRLGTALRVLWSAFIWGRPSLRAVPAVAVIPLKVLTGRGIA